MPVTVYSKNGCAPCAAVKKYLNNMGIEFREKRVDLYDGFAQELKQLGFQSVPVTIVNDQPIVGPNFRELSALRSVQ